MIGDHFKAVGVVLCLVNGSGEFVAVPDNAGAGACAEFRDGDFERAKVLGHLLLVEVSRVLIAGP